MATGTTRYCQEYSRSLDTQNWKGYFATMAKWTFKNVGIDEPVTYNHPATGKQLGPHHWLEATSNNPNDPKIIIDPWKNVFFEIGGKNTLLSQLAF